MVRATSSISQPPPKTSESSQSLSRCRCRSQREVLTSANLDGAPSNQPNAPPSLATSSTIRPKQTFTIKLVPAVLIKRSVTPDYIISLEDGRKFKSLKRHLAGRLKMTPDEYRAKWGLPRDYPMVAPNYAKARSEFAKKVGLGRKGPTAATRKKPAKPRKRAAK